MTVEAIIYSVLRICGFKHQNASFLLPNELEYSVYSATTPFGVVVALKRLTVLDNKILHFTNPHVPTRV